MVTAFGRHIRLVRTESWAIRIQYVGLVLVKQLDVKVYAW